MKTSSKQKRQNALRRAARVRSRIRGTAMRPRLTIKRSAKHIYAQLIDDVAGRTMAAASDLSVAAKGKKPLEIAELVGEALGQAGVKAGVTVAVVDRGSYRYHGRVKMLVEAADKAGVHCTARSEE